MIHALRIFMWDTMLWFLIWRGPKLFKGPAGAKAHGAKSRQWLYRWWKDSSLTATSNKRVGEWDDSACAFLDGFMHFDTEENEPPEGIRNHPSI
jgi:hypothetical protein